jgi:outer membrane lipoprotein-sorting protein
MLKPRMYIFFFLLFCVFLSGCPKRAPMPRMTTPPVKSPVDALLESFSEVDHFQSKASIRIETVQQGKRTNFLLNGTVFYKRPDRLRILGYHPLGMGVFDALYRRGQFVLLSPLEKRAYTGELSEFQDLLENAGVQISAERAPGSRVPELIRIGVLEKDTRIDLRLKNISINPPLPADAFEWSLPEGVMVIPVARLLKENPF